MPFLRNVTRGRNVPDDRLAEVAEQYERFGGRSPINGQNLALIDALRTDFEEAGVEMPIYFGNRNWEPFVGDAVDQMVADGIDRAIVFVTSAFGSYSGCRQYRENLATAGEGKPIALHKLRLFYNHPGFLEPVAEHVAAALAAHDEPARIVFTAHSIPESMAATCDYESQLREAAGLVVESLDAETHCGWDLVFQSRSGPPHIPWLTPDVNDHLRAMTHEATEADGAGPPPPVTMVPLGFISDHMEVMFDLDTQATETAAELGLRINRASTVGTHPRFVEMIRELVAEQTDAAPKLWLGDSGPWPDPCPDGHCALPARPAGAGRPPS